MQVRGSRSSSGKVATETARQDASLLETASVVAVDEVPHRSIEVNDEVWNRCVLIAIGLFAALFYFAVLYVGFAELMSRLSKSGKNKKRLRNRVTARTLRSKAPGR